MANRYDIPARQDRVNDHVDLPTNLIMNAANSVQDRWDKTAQAEDAFTKSLNVKALDNVYGNKVGDQDLVNQRLANYKAQLQTGVQKLQGNYADPEYARMINNVSADLSKDLTSGDLYHAKARYDAYTEHQDLVKKSKDYNMANWVGVEDEKYWRGYKGYRNPTTGVYDTQSNIGLADYVDRNKEFKENLSDIKTDLWKSFEKADGNGYIVGQKREGVSGDKIMDAFYNYYDNSKSKVDINKQIDLEGVRGGFDPDKTMVNRTVKYKDKNGKEQTKNVQLTYRQDQEDKTVKKLAGAMVNTYTHSTGSDNTTTDGTWQYNQQQAKEEKEKFVLSNQSTLVPGQDFSIDNVHKALELSTNQIKAIDAQIASGKGNAAELYKQKEELLRDKAISEATLNRGLTSYASTPEGQKKLEDKWKIYQGSMLNKGSIKTFEQFKKQVAETKPMGFWDGVKNFFTGIGDNSEMEKSVLNGIARDMNKEVENHIKEKPTSFSANVLTGPGVDNLNKALTDRVNNNGTNYTVEGGLTLDQWKNNNLEKGSTTSVAVMDDDIGGTYAHYMTVKDKDGKTISQVPIYPKEGREEMSMTGRWLKEQNKGQKDELQKERYNRGVKMMANAEFGKEINQFKINAQLKMDDNSPAGTKERTLPFSITKNGKQYQVEIEAERVNEGTSDSPKINTIYKLVNNGQVITQAKSLADINQQLYLSK